MRALVVGVPGAHLGAGWRPAVGMGGRIVGSVGFGGGVDGSIEGRGPVLVVFGLCRDTGSSRYASIMLTHTYVRALSKIVISIYIYGKRVGPTERNTYTQIWVHASVHVRIQMHIYAGGIYI